MGRNINETVERKLFAESMGRCMNPECKEELFKKNGDIIEKAHIVPYCSTKDNSFENLVVLCPNCHTNFDKNAAFTMEEVTKWKEVRRAELEEIFCKKFRTFKDLCKKVAPLLMENKAIFEEYYLNDKRALWDEFEPIVLCNNGKIKKMIESNLNLFQSNKNKEYSNLELIRKYLLHIEEFERTRSSVEKNRHILFPKEINSIFGVSPVNDYLLPSVESVEALIERFQDNQEFVTIEMGIDNPYIVINSDGVISNIYLNDTPRIRQLYNDYKCFRKADVRLESLNFAYKHLRSRRIHFEIQDNTNLKEVIADGIKFIFVYVYCLNKVDLTKLSPEPECVIVNLHNWNGEGCISNEAYGFAKTLNINLLTMDDFYVYISKLKSDK